MKHAHKLLLSGAALAVCITLVGSLSVPSTAAAYTTIGGSLAQAQRDFRVFNNFTDATANNNVTTHVNFPGATGAPMAIWKGQVEWASGPYAGNGLGDGLTSNVNLGDGGANFDNTYQGTTTATGNSNGNVHSELSGGTGGVLAFTETPISDGWRVRYYSSWTWQDGPGSVSSGIDLQGVACHEIGHTLGLGHSSTSGATMYFALSGTGTAARSIATDDINGIKAIYGTKSATKPVITALSGTLATGSTLTITGSNFSSSGNEVWFTKLTSDGVAQKVTGVTSSGTSISVVIPSNARDGDVLVRNNGTGNANLSNAFPLNISNALTGPTGFTSIQPGLAGSFGVPALSGAGDVSAGSAEGFTLLTTSVPSLANGLLFVSLAQGALPLKGGVLYAVPVLTQVPLVSGSSGELLLATSIPTGTPSGTTFVLQQWFLDAAGVQGASATNGLRIDVP